MLKLVQNATYTREKYLTYYPPKSQPFKVGWQQAKVCGGNYKIFPTDIKRYFEPFLGSGAILATVAPTNGMGSDAFKPLVEIWQKLATDPKGLVDWYAERRNLLETATKEEVYKAFWLPTTKIQMVLIFYF